MTRIERATSAGHIGLVQQLWRAYEAELDESLAHQGFEAELAGLPGVYAPPLGALLLALDGDGQAVGTAAMRPLTGDACELKRMVVLPEARGRGIGRALVEAICESAREHYEVIKLDTSSRWVAANALYHRCGFVECERYNDDPHPDTLFMERRLND